MAMTDIFSTMISATEVVDANEKTAVDAHRWLWDYFQSLLYNKGNVV